MTSAATVRPTPTIDRNLDRKCINTLRFLAVDAVEKANSGHPGLPMGSAAMAYALWDRFLRFNPQDPDWPNRDRFVLSAGHGSMLLYALLHLTGFDLSLEALKNFRQWGSPTPGHPEFGMTPGVEATTGPLGQGFTNAVGMAIAEEALAAQFNRPEYDIVDHYTYALVSDGDLMEGISSEAASLAGHLKLGKLIVLYADNYITIEGSTDLAFTENRKERFEAFGWQVLTVKNGNDVEAVAAAIDRGRQESEHPTFIDVHTHIGYGSPDKQDTAQAHGEPLGDEEVAKAKKNLGWPIEPTFYIPDEVRDHFRQAGLRGAEQQTRWQASMQRYGQEYPDLTAEYNRRLEGILPEDWDRQIPTFDPVQGEISTRAASGVTIEKFADRVPEFMGGAADLSPSTHTHLPNSPDFEAGSYEGRNMHFGIREHAMGAILNGMALHGGLIPFGATFLVFSDYMRPPMRLAAMSHLPVIYVFTHDSIGLGEDGPTHQPVEQLLGLRSVPNLTVIRPADGNETALAWRVALEHDQGPVALVLTRQKVPVIDLEKHEVVREGLRFGAYVLEDSPDEGQPDLILTASGSEVHLALEARARLAKDGISARVVSFPSWDLFQKQPEAYQDEVFPPGIPIVAVEAGVSLGWVSYTGQGAAAMVGVDQFGASAPGNIVMRQFGLNLENICQQAKKVLDQQDGA
ncbi:MAG: transketolase [Anaerolineales bacterium]|jgi:transketolase